MIPDIRKTWFQVSAEVEMTSSLMKEFTQPSLSPIFRDFPETSVTNYQSTLRNIAVEQKSLFEGYYGPPACPSDKSSKI